MGREGLTKGEIALRRVKRTAVRGRNRGAGSEGVSDGS